MSALTEDKSKTTSFAKKVDFAQSELREVCGDLPAKPDNPQIQARLLRKEPIEDVPTSPQIYRLAAQRAAFTQLGLAHIYGAINAPQDLQIGAQLLEDASQAGCPDATAALSSCYIFGIGRQRSYDHARSLLRRSLLQGSVDAIEIRALCWLEGTFDDARDYHVALELFGQGIVRNSSACMLWVGFCFEIGLGSAPDTSAAKEAYLAAADSKELSIFVRQVYPGVLNSRNPWALLKVSLAVLHGASDNRDHAVALSCLKQAARLGSKDAQVYLACCMLHGKWIEKDSAIATLWLQEAARGPLSHPVALKMLKWKESGTFERV